MSARLKLFVLATTLLLGMPLSSRADGQSLKITDVKTVMSELLEQHLGGQTVTNANLQDAVDQFIERADPSHLYLLDIEAHSLRNLGADALTEAFGSYQKEDYAIFSEANQKIQQGIERSRKLRQFDPTTTAELFKQSQKVTKGEEVADYNRDAYAQNDSELVQRLKANFVDFIVDQMDRFGIPEVLAKPDVIASKYEHSLRKMENDYLYNGRDGKALSDAERDNLFALHILKSLAKSLDAHTSFFDEGEAIDMKRRLEKGFQGIGIVLEEVIDGFVISDLVTDGPALRSGNVQIKDRLLKVNGQTTLGLTLDEVSHALRKASIGQEVVLGLGRGSESTEVTLKPEMIVVNEGRVDTSFEKYQDGIVGTITLHSFYEGPKDVSAANDVAAGIEKLKKQGKLLGLVLDLRDNSGGYLTQAVKVAGLFITNGVVVISKYSDGEVHYYRDVTESRNYTGPMVVLTSRLTASAAEIVAQALQDYGVALIVGDAHTYGKGTIQAQTVTDDKSASYFKVTVGQFYTVSGKTTQLRGVEADVLLPGQYSQMRIGESYLSNTVSNDKVPPAYQDDLSDVEGRAKGWYKEHYLPTLQPKETMWQAVLPELKRKSQERTQAEKSYQLFLQEISTSPKMINVEAEDAARLAKFDISAYQMEEAGNIIEDMVQLQKSVTDTNSGLGVPQEQSLTVGLEVHNSIK